MGKHLLSLNLPAVTNDGILLIDDTSTYDTLIPVSCPNIQITPPGYTSPTSIDPLVSGFRLVLNACTLGIVTANGCSEGLPCIPDGIYDIRYSVAPNDSVWVSYKVLRVVKAINRYMNLLCGVNLKCCLPDQEAIYQVQQLDLIYNFILSAKSTVENTHNFTDGLNQLRYANHLMDKMSSSKPFC